MKKFAVLLVIILLTKTTSADSSADRFGARRWPVEPILSINADSDLCSKILSDARSAFASAAPDFDVAAATAKRLKPRTWTPVFEDLANSASSFVGRLDLDLDGRGKKQVVIYRSNLFNWQGNWNYAYVFPSIASFKSVKSEVLERWIETPEYSQYPAPTRLDLGAQQYYPKALSVSDEELQTGNVWADHHLFFEKGKYFFFSGTTSFDRLRSPAISVYRLHADGKVNESCRVSLKEDSRVYNQFRATPGVDSLLKVIRAIGAGGEDCGTMHSGLQHDRQADASERRAALRPWAVSLSEEMLAMGRDYYAFDDRTRLFLELWSHEDAWSRREYQTFQEHIRPAEEGISWFLTKTFGLNTSAANIASVQVVRALIGDRFLLPSGFDAGDGSRKVYFGRQSIRDALAVRDRQALESLLEKFRSMDSASEDLTSKDPFAETLSAALPSAVEWPFGLDKLLEAGADPNEPNDFGKTPLMVAAHMNRPDSIRILLKMHVDVNAATHAIEDSCVQRLERVGRTALTYAAENASPIVMKLLLDAGANPTVVDSKGHSLDFYLSKNPRLTNQERALGVVGLSKIADSFMGPSFRCDEARTQIEKEICSSEVLAILDSEMFRAYAQFHAKRGASAVIDQRDWLSRRNASCSEGDFMSECLSEVMRTRIRYLHNRLEETAVE